MDQKDLLKEMGYRLSTKRRETGYTQEQLAELVDMTAQTISYAEQGRKAMRPETIVKICTALNMSADYLLMGKHTDEYSNFEKSFNGLTGEQQIYVKLIMDACLGLCNAEVTKK